MWDFIGTIYSQTHIKLLQFLIFLLDDNIIIQIITLSLYC